MIAFYFYNTDSDATFATVVISNTLVVLPQRTGTMQATSIYSWESVEARHFCSLMNGRSDD